MVVALKNADADVLTVKAPDPCPVYSLPWEIVDDFASMEQFYVAFTVGAVASGLKGPSKRTVQRYVEKVQDLLEKVSNQDLIKAIEADTRISNEFKRKFNPQHARLEMKCRWVPFYSRHLLGLAIYYNGFSIDKPSCF